MNAAFATRLLGWKGSPENKLGWVHVPNCADVDSIQSMVLAAGMLDNLGVTRGILSDVPKKPGGPLEQLVSEDLAATLPGRAPERR